MLNRRKTSESGASLVIVLLFMTVFGLILAALLTEGSASFGFSNAVANHEAKAYAADGGVSFGIQQVRQNNEVCPGVNMGSGPTIPDVTLNKVQVSVTCTATKGSGLGAAGFAIVTTDPTAGLNISTAVDIGGSIFVNGGYSLSNPLTISGGSFYQHGAGCPAPGTINFDPGYRKSCTSYDWHSVDPSHSPPDLSTLPPGVLDGDGGTSCRVFRPGVYLDTPNLVGTNYFASGTYYFNFAKEWPISHNTVIGGQRDQANETANIPLPGSCPQTEVSGIPAGRTGVQFIFGNQARFSLLAQSQVELFRPNFTGNRISILAVPNDWSSPPWTPNTFSGSIFDIKTGNAQIDVYVHGALYSPNQSLDIPTAQDKNVSVTGGVVVKTLSISKNKAHFLDISAEPGAPDPRYVRITATAPDPSGGQAVVSTALVRFTNDAAKNAVVNSWRTSKPGEQ